MRHLLIFTFMIFSFCARYFFYSGDPLVAAHPISVWGGSAMVFETTEIAKWVSSNVKGIPNLLAKCFAWHVTINRDL